ncbi:MAG: ATP-binding protein, partial [Myxococcota bacterium]|nr:ATP-binding protein [Myxococcota bacterium]
MRRLSLRAQILGAFLLAFMAFVGALGDSLVRLQSIGDELIVIDQGYLPLSKVAAQLESFQARLEVDVSRISRSTVRDIPRSAWPATLYTERIREAVVQGVIIVESALNTPLPPQERAVLTSLRGQLELIGATHDEYAEVGGHFLDLAESGQMELLPALEGELLNAQTSLETEISQFSARVDESTRRVYQRTANTQKRAVLVSGALALAALLFGTAMLALSVVSLRPISRLTAEVQKIAGGDYEGRLTVDRRDELGTLAEEINAMARSIEQRDEDLRSRAIELDNARAHLKSILDSIRLGLIVVNENRVVMANPAATEMWGVTIDSPLSVFLDINSEAVEDRVVQGRSYEVRRVPFQGGAILVGEDVTERHRVRERLVRSERLALIGQMLAQITHEVRNPLNALSLNAELLREEFSDLPPESVPETEAILSTMSEGIKHLELVTERYLALTRQPAPSLEAEEPATIALGVARLLDEELKQAGVALDLDTPLVGEVELDGHQIRSALLNVVRNAVEAGASEVKMEIELADSQLRIRVTDNGCGLNDSELAQAPDPFFSTKASGTGLGLAITRQILEAHGGHLSVTSPGKGAVVVLTL